jgi:hypothetical protein
MPVYNRRYLRQRLGQEWLRDTIVGRVTATLPVGSLNLQDVSLADPTMSGEAMYFRHWMRVTGPDGVIHDTRVASFNTGTGHFVMGVAAADNIEAGSVFEVHSQLSPQEKDRALDAVIRDIHVQREMQVDAVDGANVYDLPGIVDAINLIVNPSVEHTRYGFAGANDQSQVSRQFLSPILGRYSLRVADTFPTLSGYGVTYDMAGKWRNYQTPHIFSAYVRADIAAASIQLRAHLGATVVLGETEPLLQDDVRRLSLRFTSPPASVSGTQHLIIYCYVETTEPVHSFVTDGWMCEEESEGNAIGQPSDYVDGDQPECRWLGEPHASRSVRYVRHGYDILDVRYLADPSNTLNPGERQIDWFRVDATGSEWQELRISPALRANQVLILDTLQGARLGEHDLAVVDIPSADLVLAGAAARCLWLMEQQSPGQERGVYAERRKEAAKLYTQLAARYKPAVTRRVMLDEPW